MMFRVFRLSIVASILLLSASAGFGPSTASPPSPDAPKAAPKPAAKLSPSSPPGHGYSGLIGVNKQTVYSSSGSTFAQTRRVFRTERPSSFQNGASRLWDKDRAEDQQRQQRRARQRAQQQQTRLRLQKQILRKPSPLLSPSPTPALPALPSHR